MTIYINFEKQKLSMRQKSIEVIYWIIQFLPTPHYWYIAEGISNEVQAESGLQPKQTAGLGYKCPMVFWSTSIDTHQIVEIHTRARLYFYKVGHPIL